VWISTGNLHRSLPALDDVVSINFEKSDFVVEAKIYIPSIDGPFDPSPLQLTHSHQPTMPTFTVYKGDKDGYPKKGSTTRPDELTGDLVHVKVTASGLCGTGKLDTLGDR